MLNSVQDKPDVFFWKWFFQRPEVIQKWERKKKTTLFPVILPYPDFYRTRKHKRLSASSVSSRGHRRPSHRISRNAAVSANFKVSHFSLRALLMKTHLQWFLLIIVMVLQSYRGHLDSISGWTSPFKAPSPPSISSSSALFGFQHASCAVWSAAAPPHLSSPNLTLHLRPNPLFILTVRSLAATTTLSYAPPLPLFNHFSSNIFSPRHPLDE